MARLTEASITKAERTAIAHLQEAIGFAPKILFGRDSASYNHILQRLIAEGTPVVYAVAELDSTGAHSKHVREYRLLVAPVPVKLGNGTRKAATPRRAQKKTRSWSHAERARIAVGVKAAWAKKRAAAKVAQSA